MHDIYQMMINHIKKKKNKSHRNNDVIKKNLICTYKIKSKEYYNIYIYTYNNACNL